MFPIPIDLVSSLIPTLGKGVNNDGDDCDDDDYYFHEIGQSRPTGGKA